MSLGSDLGLLPRIEDVSRRELLTITIAAALFAACRGDSDDKEAGPEDSAAGGFPVTIRHAKGETTIPAKPERVVAVGGLDAALANALGVDVVAVPTFMKEYPWYRTPLRGDVQVLGYQEVDLEAIAALKPDVILITTAWPLYGETYDRLSAIAPTIPHLKALLQDDPVELTRTIGRVLGDPAGAEKLIADSQAAIDALVARHPGLAGKQFSLIQISGETIYLVGLDGSLTSNFMRQLGLTSSEEIQAVIKAAGLSAGQGQISYERAYLLDTVDIVFLSDPGGAEKTFRSNPAIAELDVVKSGNLVLLDQVAAAALLMPSPVNIPHLLDQLEPALSKLEDVKKGS